MSRPFILSSVEHGTGKAHLQQWSVRSPVKRLCHQTEGLSFLVKIDEWIRCTFSVHLVVFNQKIIIIFATGPRHCKA